MKRHLCAVAAVMFLFSAASLADEGFFTFTSQTPAAVTAVEPYTVALWGEKGGVNDGRNMATAFLVKVKSEGKKNLGLFVTCAHVFGACGGNSCGLRLYHGYELIRNDPQSLGGSAVWSADIKEILRGDKNQEKLNQAHDLAAFTAEIPATLNNPPRIRAWAAPESRTVYAIGSPDTALRAVWGKGVTPPPSYFQLLWSYGSAVIYETIPYSKNNQQRILFHVADLLPGNSGGPLFDANGAIVGVNSKASDEGVNAKGKKEAFIYNDQSDNIAIPAETLLQFLDTVQF